MPTALRTLPGAVAIARAGVDRTLRKQGSAPDGPASRRPWRDEALASEFADLVTWRDALYAAWRR